jgi:hypothetical protein
MIIKAAHFEPRSRESLCSALSSVDAELIELQGLSGRFLGVAGPLAGERETVNANRTTVHGNGCNMGRVGK